MVLSNSFAADSSQITGYLSQRFPATGCEADQKGVENTAHCRREDEAGSWQQDRGIAQKANEKGPKVTVGSQFADLGTEPGEHHKDGCGE
jgi:hypothetical protein